MKRQSSKRRVLTYNVNRIRGGRYLDKSTKAIHFMAEWHKKNGAPYPEWNNQKWYGRVDFITKKADRIMDKEVTLGVKYPPDSKEWRIPERQLPNAKAIEFEETVNGHVRRIAPQLNEWNDYEVYLCNRVALITQLTWTNKRAIWERKDFHYVDLDSQELHVIPAEEMYPEITPLLLWARLKRWQERHSEHEVSSSNLQGNVPEQVPVAELLDAFAPMP